MNRRKLMEEIENNRIVQCIRLQTKRRVIQTVKQNFLILISKDYIILNDIP